MPAPDRLNRNRPRKKLEWSQTKRCREAGHVVRERAAFGTPRDVRFEQHRFELGDLRVEPKREKLASTLTVRTGSALFLHTSSGRRSFEIVSNERGSTLTGLEPSQDAYGQILLAALEGRKSDEILERDDGLIYCGDPNDYFAPFRRWPPVERRAMRYVRGRVLDVGCGAGRISLHLQERGHEVLAIDESPLAVEVTRRRGVQDAEVRSLADVDASLGQFDSVLIVRNNFGLVGQEGRAVTVLRRLALITTEHGRIVTDSVDPERVEGRAFREYRTRGRNSVRPLAQRLRVRFERYTSPWFHYLMFTPDEMVSLVEGSGWRVLRVIDDGSPRYAVVLEKVTQGARPRPSPPP